MTDYNVERMTTCRAGSPQTPAPAGAATLYIGSTATNRYPSAKGGAIRPAERFSGHRRFSPIMTAHRRTVPATDRRRDRC